MQKAENRCIMVSIRVFETFTTIHYNHREPWGSGEDRFQISTAGVNKESGRKWPTVNERLAGSSTLPAPARSGLCPFQELHPPSVSEFPHRASQRLQNKAGEPRDAGGPRAAAPAPSCPAPHQTHLLLLKTPLRVFSLHHQTQRSPHKTPG